MAHTGAGSQQRGPRSIPTPASCQLDPVSDGDWEKGVLEEGGAVLCSSLHGLVGNLGILTCLVHFIAIMSEYYVFASDSTGRRLASQILGGSTYTNCPVILTLG